MRLTISAFTLLGTLSSIACGGAVDGGAIGSSSGTSGSSNGGTSQDPATGGGGTATGSSGTSPGGVSPDSNACDNTGAFTPLQGARIATGLDWVGLYKNHASASTVPVSAVGQKCRNAANYPVCANAVLSAERFVAGWEASLTPGGGPDLPPVRYFAIHSKADDVASAVTLNQFVDLLLPIDTPSEAATVAFMRGYAPDCSKNNVRKIEYGYEVHAVTGGQCGQDLVDHLVSISSRGVFNVIYSTKIRAGDPGCANGG